MADFDFSKSDIELLKEFLTYPNDFRYPVGTILISNEDSFSPASEYGGDWELLPEGYALWTASSGAGKTISAGLPNIEATWSSYSYSLDTSGAVSSVKNGNGPSTGSSYKWAGFTFNANAGASTKGIYGNSTTVQPPAYKIKMWKKIKTEKEMKEG